MAASQAILAAIVFDSLDGRIARFARATSQFGVEYDSLSDLVSFGVAPAILMYQWSLNPFGRLGWICAFIYLACAALRLARFNVTTSVLPKGYFQGIPSPGAAGMLVTYYIFVHSMEYDRYDLSYFNLILSVFLGFLMVSTIPFPSFKDFNWRSRATFGYLMLAVLSLIFIVLEPTVTPFVILSGYVGASLLWNLVRLIKGAKPLAVAEKSPLEKQQEKVSGK